MPAHENLHPDQFFHGTYATLKEGDELTPGAERGVQNFPPKGDNTKVYLSSEGLTAYDWGSQAAKAARRRNVHVYEVEPLGEVEDLGNKGLAVDRAKVLRRVSSEPRKR